MVFVFSIALGGFIGYFNLAREIVEKNSVEATEETAEDERILGSILVGLWLLK